jgi:ABC-type uncharacterized transport system permease subunit
MAELRTNQMGSIPVRFEKRLTSSKTVNILVPIISVILALLLGSIFILISGNKPLEVYQIMLTGAFGTKYGLSETIVKAIPLTITGLAVSIAFKMQLWNIGAEGQLYIGAWAASYVALFMPGVPDYLVLPLMILLAFIGGAIWGLLPAIPRALMGVNETITTLLLNYVATLWVAYFVYGPWRDPQGFNFPLTAPFGDSARLTRFFDTRVHSGIFIALILALIIYFLLNRTKWGYEIKVIGQSQNAARYAGMNIKRNIMLVLALSGGLAGIAGMVEVSGLAHRLQITLSPGYGYTAIIIAWLAKLNPLVIIIVSFLFGGLLVGGYSVQAIGLPLTTSTMIQGLILFCVLGGEIFSRYRITVRRKGAK